MLIFMSEHRVCDSVPFKLSCNGVMLFNKKPLYTAHLIEDPRHVPLICANVSGGDAGRLTEARVEGLGGQWQSTVTWGK